MRCTARGPGALFNSLASSVGVFNCVNLASWSRHQNVEDQEADVVKGAPVYYDLRAGDSVKEEDVTSLAARAAAAGLIPSA